MPSLELESWKDEHGWRRVLRAAEKSGILLYEYLTFLTPLPRMMKSSSDSFSVCVERQTAELGRTRRVSVADMLRRTSASPETRCKNCMVKY
jgi:hypothetical protein